jgi:hypothetical protein
MTSTHFLNLIQAAERGPRPSGSMNDPRFVPTRVRGVRTLGSSWLRANARGSLWLADRMDPQREGQRLAA